MSNAAYSPSSKSTTAMPLPPGFVEPIPPSNAIQSGSSPSPSPHASPASWISAAVWPSPMRTIWMP
jgi:hypothetical protein